MAVGGTQLAALIATSVQFLHLLSGHVRIREEDAD